MKYCHFPVHFLFVIALLLELPSNILGAEVCKPAYGFIPVKDGCEVGWQVWSAPSGAEVTFAEAQDYCSSLAIPEQKYQSWRLPTAEDFISLSKKNVFESFGLPIDNFFWSALKSSEASNITIHPTTGMSAGLNPNLSTAAICVADFKEAPNPSEYYSVSAGHLHTCAIDKEGVKCWGDIRSGVLNVPELVNPTQLTSGKDFTCALANDSLKCWGSMKQTAQLHNPRKITSGDHTVCVDTESDVKCWTKYSESNSFVKKKVKEPDSMVTTDKYICVSAIDAPWPGEPECWKTEWRYWGRDYGYEITLPTPSNISHMAASETRSCVIARSAGVICDKGVSGMPHLKNPKQLAVRDNSVCALDDAGVQCWGSFHVRSVPPLRRPISISVGQDHACAIDMDGVKCWGDNSYGQINVPELKF